MALISNNVLPYPALTHYRGPKDIEQALKTEGVAEIVDQKAESILSVAKAISQLEQVGSLLQLAYAGSHGFPCSEQIVQIMVLYQDLIKASSITSDAFVRASLKALNLHVEALELAGKKDLNAVAIVLSTCEQLAGKMVQESQKLVEASTTLKNKSAKALRLATKDNAFSKKQQADIEKSLNESKESEAALEQQKEDLARDLEKELKDEKEAIGAANRAQIFSNITSVLSVFAKPALAVISPAGAAALALKNVLHGNKKKDSKESNAFEKALEERTKIAQSLETAKIQLVSAETKLGLENSEEKKKELLVEIAELKEQIKIKDEALKQQEIDIEELKKAFQHQAESAQQRADTIMKRRVDMQQQLRKANMDLAVTITRLEHLDISKNNLEFAVTSLQISIKMLGKITTIFQDTRKFWLGVQTQCENLEKNEVLNVMKRADQDRIIIAIKNSGLDWLTLGENTRLAHEAMEKIENKYDEIISNLPTEKEAAQLIKPLVQNVLKKITEENIQLAIAN